MLNTSLATFQVCCIFYYMYKQNKHLKSFVRTMVVTMSKPEVTKWKKKTKRKVVG